LTFPATGHPPNRTGIDVRNQARTRRLCAAALALAAVFSAAAVAGEYRFSAQTSLLAPDPFLRPKPTPTAPRASVPLPKLQEEAAKPEPTVAEARLAAFPGHMPVDAIARLTLGSRTLKLIRQIEVHFSRSAEIVSGCRTHAHNLEVGGAPRSYHLTCLAADIELKGIAVEDIRDFVLTLPSRGGVGTYCGLDTIHIDAGPPRQWHRPCGALAWHEPGARLAAER
jgi:hypothetical protein